MTRVQFEEKYGISDAKVFLDDAGRPYLTGEWEGEPWLFYWHPDNSWVSLRKLSDGPMLLVEFLPENEQEIYLK